MDEVILSMLEKYKCVTKIEYENALKEIIQEIALLGLWRSKFFEHALFYGDTALRILYGLNRFSEDMDFSLLKPNSNFKLTPYLKAIETELQSFGFEVNTSVNNKTNQSAIESAFIKAGTSILLVKTKVPDSIIENTQGNEVLKIKVEIDTDPPGKFNTDVKNLLQPIPFQIKTMTLESLFAGKMHAVLARKWKTRVKGRDFYDLLWYIGRGTQCDLTHLKERLIQSGDWNQTDNLKEEEFRNLLITKIENTDFKQAKKDVSPFLKPREYQSLDMWSTKYFLDVISRLEVT